MEELTFQERLIDEVKSHQHLYASGDRKCKEKASSWADIGKKLTKEVEFCRKKWRALRDRFVKAKKNGTVSSSPILARMEWLSPHVKHRSITNDGVMMVSFICIYLFFIYFCLFKTQKTQYDYSCMSVMNGSSRLKRYKF